MWAEGLDRIIVQNDPVNWIDPIGLLNVNPNGSISGVDAYAGPTAFITSGVSLLLVGSEISKWSATIIALGGPVGWIGGGIVLAVGLTMMGVGAYSTYHGLKGFNVGFDPFEPNYMDQTPNLPSFPIGPPPSACA